MPATPSQFLKASERGTKNIIANFAAGGAFTPGSDLPAGVVGFSFPPISTRGLLTRDFTVQHAPVGAAAITSATLQPVGSFDGTHWFPVGSPIAAGVNGGMNSVNLFPLPYLSVVCTAISLGAATSLEVSVSA